MLYYRSNTTVQEVGVLRSYHTSEMIAFRASPVLATAIYRRAEEAGCSVSEFLRSIAREKVGLQ